MGEYESNIREAFLQRDTFMQGAPSTIHEGLRRQVEEENWGRPGEAAEFIEFMFPIFERLAKEHADVVFGVTESPIEKIILNSMFIGSLLYLQPLVVMGGVVDFPAWQREYREHIQLAGEFYTWLERKHGSKADLVHYVEEQVRIGKMPPDEAPTVVRFVLYYHYLWFQNTIHINLQAGFPELRIDGRSSRVDMVIWVPSDPTLNLVVECDGFQYHSSRESFDRDRRRDRLFQANGYDVRRYSGTEIHNRPVEVGKDLLDYLMDRLPSVDDEDSVV